MRREYRRWKIGGSSSSGIFLTTYMTTRRHNPEDLSKIIYCSCYTECHSSILLRRQELDYECKK
jgi:hypothetical protein